MTALHFIGVTHAQVTCTSKSHRIELHSIWCTFLVQVSGTRELSLCHPYEVKICRGYG